MRRKTNRFKRASERAAERSRIGHKFARNERILAALEFDPIRSVKPVLMFVVSTHNPFSGYENLIEIVKEVDTKRGKYAVYLNGERWRNGWSRSRFAAWMVRQIGSVLEDE